MFTGSVGKQMKDLPPRHFSLLEGGAPMGFLAGLIN